MEGTITNISSAVMLNGKKITHFACRDCGKVSATSKKKLVKTLRPNNKFCDPDCRAYVLGIFDGVVEHPNIPNDSDHDKLTLRVDDLTRRMEMLEIARDGE